VRPRVLVVVQNLPVPFDRRVWLESCALRDAGFDVTVISPKGPGDPARQDFEGVRLLKYRQYAPGSGSLGYVFEYLYSFSATALMTCVGRAEGRFDVMQACNPPDIFWPIARILRLLDGTRFVFDHHDLCPELFRSRFPSGGGLAYRGLLALERATFHAADEVIATNDSYAAIARSRGGKAPEDVHVVRTGPDDHRLVRMAPDPALRRGRDHLVAYIGVMGPQDGVDLAVRAVHYIVNEMGRADISFTFMGSGDCHPELVRLHDELGLQDFLELPGRVSDEFVVSVLSTADVGLSPDPSNPLNDVSTMNKTMEYMAFELPVVAFELPETRTSAADAAWYATPNDVAEFAKGIVTLIDDPTRRGEMGARARHRIENVLAWRHQSPVYVQTYRELVGQGALARNAASPESRS
jgi:glycosyltransferase involved in cell wall biosynthesis